VLLGKENERMQKFGHTALSTYGIGTEHTSREWHSLIRQIVAQGLIYVDMDAHGGLKISERGRAFLKNKDSLKLRIDRNVSRETGTSFGRGQKRDPVSTLENPEDQALFQSLKSLRLSIAKEQNVPPYIVFHDRTLMDMVVRKPATLEEMGVVPGVGQSKLLKYGAIFLKELLDQK